MNNYIPNWKQKTTKYYVFRRLDDGYVAAIAGTVQRLDKNKFEILLETENWDEAYDKIVKERNVLS